MEAISSPVPAASHAGASTIADPGGKPVARAYVRAALREAASGPPVEPLSGALRVIVPLSTAALAVALSPVAGTARRVRMAEPDLCIVPPGMACDVAVEESGPLLVLVLDDAWRERVRSALGHVPEIRSAHVGPDPFVRRIAGLLAAGQGGADEGWSAAIADDLAIHLATRHGRPAQAPAYAGLAPHRLQRVLALIEERLADPMPVHDLAAAVGMSPYHFARMFKQSTGHPPHHYITWQRVDRAKELLARSSLPLAEVATRVGYRTQAHFTGVFHARVGLTPRAYRLRCLGAEGEIVRG
jgi:AraC family transcriptional regulator